MWKLLDAVHFFLARWADRHTETTGVICPEFAAFEGFKAHCAILNGIELDSEKGLYRTGFNASATLPAGSVNGFIGRERGIC
jgi:hypothetical protein